MKTKFQILILSIPLLLIVAIYGCNGKEDLVTPPPHEEIDPKYPTIFYPISENRKNQIQHEFDTLNNYKICTYVNNYGFTGKNHYRNSYQSIPISKDSAFNLAVNLLLKNSKYANTKDSSTLISSGYEFMSFKEGTQWKITFGPQIYNGIEIPYTWIDVWVYGKEPYSINGHWFPDIYIPSNYKIEKEAAKQKTVGRKILWYDYGGNPREFIIRNEDISDNITEAIFPVYIKNSATSDYMSIESIELRVTWKIPIDFEGMIGWHIYLDVMNEETVAIIQEFRT